MKQFKQRLLNIDSNIWILGLILLWAAVLRFYNFASIPFTHDEYSALFRLRFESFADLIKYGVVTTDTHPAGVQVFLYYYSKLFGFEPWTLKLPFALMGLVSVWLAYRLAAFWYNKSVGLFTAAFMAGLQFTVMYSQIARPYISGLFLVLWLMVSWSKLVKIPDQKFGVNALSFAFSAALCAYNHHFSMLLAAIVGISGLFLIQKEWLKKYFLFCALAVLLYVPNLPIVLAQLKVGGLTWISKPDLPFVLGYFHYIFNYSWGLVLLTLALVLLSLTVFRNKTNQKTPTLLFAFWFVLPLAIGFVYSVYVAPVLQYSMLIFGLPLFFMVLFSRFRELKPIQNVVMVIAILVGSTFSLVVNRKHYNLFYTSLYKNILEDAKLAVSQYSEVFSIIDSHPKITNELLVNNPFDTAFIWFSDYKSIGEFEVAVRHASKMYHYFYFGVTSGNNPASVPIITDFFPLIVWQHNYFGATTYLFSKDSIPIISSISHQSFSRPNLLCWTNIDDSNIVTETVFKHDTCYRLVPSQEWGPTFECRLNQMVKHQNGFIDVEVSYRFIAAMGTPDLILAIEGTKGVVFYTSSPLELVQADSIPDGWSKVRYSVKLSDVKLKGRNLTFKTFIWNKSKSALFIDDYTIRYRAGNPVIYGLYEPITLEK